MTEDQLKQGVGTGKQDFERMRVNGDFYVDKTGFIREWWKGRDAVTLITRPSGFGKTMNLSALNCFFSNQYADRGDLFEGLDCWKDPAMRRQQGQWPVIFLSFAGVWGRTYAEMMEMMKSRLTELFSSYPELYAYRGLLEKEKTALNRIREEMSDTEAALSVQLLSSLLSKIYEKKVLIFLDEYDTPLQEAVVNGYWDQMAAFLRTIFINALKANFSLERAVLTGITHISRDAAFSDLNHLEVVPTTSDKYAAAFGFTEEEVFEALKRQGFGEKDRREVKEWADGFTFGGITDMYNPWSVMNFLDKGKIDESRANASENSLVETLLQRGDPEIKSQFESLMKGGCVTVPMDEQITCSQLDTDPEAVWSLLLAMGYLKIIHAMTEKEAADLDCRRMYTLSLPNQEVRRMFFGMIQNWFKPGGGLTKFAKALLDGDTRGVNVTLNNLMLNCMSSFDGGKNPSVRMPENFCHGLVLGLLAEDSEYIVTSNRESGWGRYDVVMEPRNLQGKAVIMEFKIYDPLDDEEGLEDTARNALRQIGEKRYETDLLSRGIPAENILRYGFAFRGKECLIRKG